MKLWKLTRTDHWSYAEYDSAVVAAPDAETAREIGPMEYAGGWTLDPNTLIVELLGDGYDGEKGVILASFNAG